MKEQQMKIENYGKFFLEHDMVPEQFKNEDWLIDETYYPLISKILTKVTKELEIKSYLEIGTLVGYSLMTFVDSIPTIENVKWVDGELYIGNSNEQAERNFKKFLEIQDRKVSYEFSTSIEYSNDLVGKYDLIYIDGDHTYDGKIKDLDFALSLKPKLIALDDFYMIDDVKRSVIDWCLKNRMDMSIYYTLSRGLVFIHL